MARKVEQAFSECDLRVGQSQRDCVLQPKVAESARLPWVVADKTITNRNAVVADDMGGGVMRMAATALRLENDLRTVTQSSSCLATLGWDGIPLGFVPDDLLPHERLHCGIRSIALPSGLPLAKTSQRL
jgi:hypothetical protein